MNCADCHDLLQQILDGEQPADRGALDQHLLSCPECRSWHGAAVRLTEGLRLYRHPTPPAGLSERIAADVLRDRHTRLRFRRGVYVAFAVAAGILAAFYLGSNLSTPDSSRPVEEPPIVEKRPTPEVAPMPSLADRVAEAGSAVASLTRRTADDTLGQTRLLFSVPVPTADLDETGTLKQTFDPPAQSLREAGQGVAQGLEPVTSSARRAVNLFLRDLPPLDAGNRGGL